MARSLIAETTFVVDLDREARRGRGPAHRFLREHQDDFFFLTFTVVGELACGRVNRLQWEALTRPFAVIGFDREIAWEYGRAYQHLARNGVLIGANDLWIAATGLAKEMPVVTRNTKHFERVPRLEVISY